MAKRVLKLKVRLPPYNPPRNSWRKAIHARAHEQAIKAGIVYQKSDKLEIIISIYLKGSKLFVHDVDNRLKDILDALQGRMGGSKKYHKYPPIIPNDNQVYRVGIEKIAPPAQSLGLGHLLIRKYAPK